MRRTIFDGTVTLEVEVVAVLDDRMRIRYPSGGEITVPQSWLVKGQLPVAPRSNPALVRDAVTSGLPLLKEAQYIVLRALAMAGSNGLIDDEHLEIDGKASTSAGKRRGELRRKGLVADSGLKRKTRWQTAAIVWVITQAGLEALRVHEELLQPA